MIQIPNYSIEKEVGRGGMATVYLALQDMLSRHVALKVMLPDMARDENFRKSFLSEGTIIASLEHPNIVRIHDIGVIDDSVLYMAMEYLAGGTLKERIGQGKLSFAESARILEEVSQGLAYAHAKGYIHRDIKPGNILFRDNGTAVLTDFGIAKLQDTSGELTRLGFTMGTVQYMSPEQVITTDLDQRSDIYSLGLVFYEMLTGLKAFKAESTVQAIHQHTTVPPPQLPSEYAFLQNTMDKVLAKEPENRFQTIEEFVKAVNEADDADKTVIHRIDTTSQNLVDDDKTQVFKPINKTEKTKKKRGFGLIAGLLGGLSLAGLITFGALNYPEIMNKLEVGGLFSDKKQPLEEGRLRQESLQQETEIEQQQRILEEQREQAELDKQQEDKRLEDELEHKKQLEAERLYQEKLDRIKAENEDKEQQEALEKQRAEESEKERLEALEQQRIEEAQEIQADLDRQREQEENDKLEALEQQRIEEAEELQAQLERQREQEDEQKLQAEREKNQQQARERKQAEEKALARKRAKDAAKKKKDLARKKARENERKKKALAIKRAEEKKRKAAEVARRKAEAERIRKQKANARGQIRVSATLNRKPFKTSFVVTKNGKRVQTISGRSSANFSLPPGRYTITSQFAGKVARAVVNLNAYEIAEQRFAFKGRAPAPRPPQQRAPANSTWTHSHKPAAQPRSQPVQKPKPKPKPQVKKESAADRMVREVDELWFQRD